VAPGAARWAAYRLPSAQADAMSGQHTAPLMLSCTPEHCNSRSRHPQEDSKHVEGWLHQGRVCCLGCQGEFWRRAWPLRCAPRPLEGGHEGAVRAHPLRNGHAGAGRSSPQAPLWRARLACRCWRLATALAAWRRWRGRRGPPRAASCWNAALCASTRQAPRWTASSWCGGWVGSVVKAAPRARGALLCWHSCSS
jgi:hypothetical protein